MNVTLERSMAPAVAEAVQHTRSVGAENERLRREMRQLRAEISFEVSAVHQRAASMFFKMSRRIPDIVVPVPANPVVAERYHEALKDLTPREIEVLRLIGEGKRTKEIAYQLGITFKTAVTHRSNIMEKLGIHEGPRLVRLAIRTGLVTV